MSKCRFCGNNPVPNHFLFWLGDSWIIVMTPLNMFLERTFVGQALQWFVDKLLHTFLRLLHWFGWVKFKREVEKASVDRARVLWEEAERRGIKMESAYLWGREIDHYRAVVNGQTIYFNGLPRPRAADSIHTWLDDKAILKERLMEAGLPVGRGGSFSSYRKALKMFRKLSKPVIVKPRLGSRGRHTTTFIYTEGQFKQGFEVAKQLCHWVVVEEHLVGSVYRGTVIGGKLVGVLGGSPPRITGDGVHTIADLIEQKNAAKPSGVKDVKITPTTLEFLARNGLALDSILPNEKIIDLTEKIGVSYGGTSFEITNETHPEIKRVLEEAAKIVQDPIIGFDFIIEDPTRSPEGQKWGIIECNGMPFINLHHEPLIGEPNNVARHIWDLLEQEN